MKTARRIGRIILIPAIAVLILLLSVMIAVQIPAIQTKIAQYAVKELNDTFGTKIFVDRVAIDYFGDINLYGVSTKDDRDLEFIHINRLQAKLSLTGIIRNPNRITIKKLTLFEPDVKVMTYPGDSISNFIQLIDKFSSEEKKEKSDFLLRGNVEIKDGKLLIRNENLPEYKQDWIRSSNLNTRIENFKLENDEIWAELKHMSFDAVRKGENYQVQNFSGNIHYSDQEIRVDELHLKTVDTDLKGHLVFSYDSNEDLKDFSNKVKWDVLFEDDSKVNFKDIRYFVDDFDKNSTLDVVGKVSGTLNNLQLNNFQISGEGAFIAAEELALLDMTEGEKIIIDSKAVKIKTSYRDLTHLLPTFISQSIPDFMNRFGTMDYKGNFNLNPSEIIIDGYAITGLGDADMRVKLRDYRNNLQYSGTVVADDLNLKQITEVPELGFVSGQINFDGQGTDIKNLRVDAEGKLSYLDLMEKRYQNVSVNGRIANQKFDGLLTIDDPYLSVDYNGVFDFSTQPFHLNFKSRLKHVNLDYLGLTKNLNAKVQADVEGNFSLRNIDDFLGQVNLKNVYFTSKQDTINIDHASIVSSKKGGNQNLEIDIPNYLRGEVYGNFRLSQLPDAILNSVGSTMLLTYKPTKVTPNQNFNFFFEVEQDLFNLLDPRIQVAPGTIIDGWVDADTHTMVAELSSSQIGYDGFVVYNPLINVDTSKEIEQIYLRSDSLLAKSVMMYQVNLHTTTISDSLLMKADFKIGREMPMDFDFNMYQTMDENKNLVFGFSPSTLNIDGNIWNLNPNNDRDSNRVILNFNKNYYELQNLILESDEQKLLLDGYYASNTDYKLNADLNQLVLSRIIPKGLLGDLKIDGVANGDVNVLRTKHEFKPFTNLRIEDLALNDYGLGDFFIDGVYNVEENLFEITSRLEQKQVDVLSITGTIDNKPATPEIDLTANLDDLNFKFIESFLSVVMSNVRGMVGGLLKFKGPIDSPSFYGNLDLRNLGFTVDFLNVDYQFDGENTVEVNKESGGQGTIQLENLEFRDTKFNTKGVVDGMLLFRDFATWYLNLAFQTDKLLVMNTTPAHNDLFYGKVFGAGVFTIDGPPERLDIEATADIIDDSEFTINTGATKVESQNSLVRFIPDQEKEKEDGAPKGMNIDLVLSATPSTTINLIFDPVTDDRVTANGTTDDLKFNLSRSGNMTMNGVYTLESGNYHLRQIPLVSRDFEIEQGSFVRWNGGSAFDADMQILATYERIVSNVGEYLGAGFSQTYDVEIGINITESLSNPKIDFTLDIPKAGTDVQSLIDYKFNLDPDEKMIQIGSILLLGQFISESDAVFTAGATSTGVGIAFRQLSSIIESLASGFSIDFDYVTGSSLSNTSDQFRTKLKFDLSPRWTINGALGLSVGGDAVANQNTTFETEAQWDISRNMDKSIVINFFTRPTNFGVENMGGTGNFQSIGAGLTYKTSFDRLSEIFRKDKNLPTVELKKTYSDEPPSLFDLPEYQTPSEPPVEEQKSIPDSTQKGKEVSQATSTKQSKRSKNSLIRFK